MAKTSSDSAADQNWPTLEQQLAASKVIAGSAFDHLIRDNQQLEMLRPDEARDRLRVPPWLRVYWRKLHPDADYSPPSGGYPLTLVDLHEWMMEHQDLVAPPADVQDPNDPRPPAKHRPSDSDRPR